MKSESGVRFTKKLELAKDTHEFELREGAPSGSLSTQPCASEDYLQPAPQAWASPLRVGGILCPVCALGGRPPPSLTSGSPSWVSGSKSLCAPHSQFLLCTWLCSFHACEHFLTLFLQLGPPPNPVAFSSRGVGELLPHPVQHRSQRRSWACLGLHCFFQTFILPLSAEQSSCPRSWDRMPLPL